MTFVGVGMNCLNSECSALVPEAVRFCPTCGEDNGYPNVRQADAEREYLSRRLKKAEEDARSRSCLDQLIRLRELVRKSVAVIATNPNKAHALLKDSSETYTSFYRLVDAGVRTPSGNWFDQVRGVADELLFPNYRQFITFAALSLTGTGCGYYGSVHLVLAEFAIRQRATTFEENSLYFCQRRRLGVHEALPPGYRAVWEQRDYLAAAKLASNIHSSTSPEEFPRLLLSRPDEADADFIEVHIFERLNSSSVQRVIIGRGGSEDDAIMKRLLVHACRRSGIPCDEL